jgi:multidrug efflux pump subunit AcrB
MSGVDNMNYMYSISANNGVMRMGVNFDVKTDPNIDQVLAQLRENQAASQLPASVQQLWRHAFEIAVESDDADRLRRRTARTTRRFSRITPTSISWTRSRS